MTGLEVAALGLVGVWLAALSAVMVVVVRHVGLLTLRIQAGHVTEGDGLLIGDRVPADAIAVASELDRDLRYLVFLSESCSACFELAPQLSQVPDSDRFVACVVGDSRASQRLLMSVPGQVASVSGSDAKRLADAFRVRQTPQVLQVENGILVGRAVPRSLDDVVGLINAYDYSDAHDVAIRMREEHEHAAV